MPDSNPSAPPTYDPNDGRYLKYLKLSRDEYVRSSNRWLRGMWLCQCMTVASTIVAGIAAASLTDANLSYMKWVSVAASVLAAASLTVSREFRVQEMTTLRDDGRREMDDILSYAYNSLLQHHDNPEERFKARETIRLRVLDLERRQGQQWRTLHQRVNPGPLTAAKLG